MQSGGQSSVPHRFHQAPSHPTFSPGDKTPNEHDGRALVSLKHNNVPSLLRLRRQLTILPIDNASELREQQ